MIRRLLVRWLTGLTPPELQLLVNLTANITSQRYERDKAYYHLHQKLRRLVGR